jgi:superfamily II RNA helicase
LGGMQLLEADERRQTSAFVHHCIMRLKPADRILPQVRSRAVASVVMSLSCVVAVDDWQVERTAALLDRGIAVHHGGLLPLVKEMVPFVFCCVLSDTTDIRSPIKKKNRGNSRSRCCLVAVS